MTDSKRSLDKEKLNNIYMEVVKNIKEIFGDDLIGVILYGSYARGDYNDESDIDIALLIDKDRISLKRYNDLLVSQMTHFMLEHDVFISFNEIPFKEFEEYKEVLPYYKNIDKEGVNLVAWGKRSQPSTLSYRKGKRDAKRC